jgi:hypothetical protein
VSSSTRIPIVMDALADQLRQRPGLQQLAVAGIAWKGPVPIDVGFPPQGPRALHIWIDGDVEEWEQSWANTGIAGIAPRDELFTLTVNHAVSLMADTFVKVRDLAVVMADELASLLVDDFSIAGTAEMAQITGGTLSEGVLSDGQRECLIEQKLRIRTYIPAELG